MRGRDGQMLARFFVAAFFTWSVGLPATVAPGHVISLVAWFCFDGMTWAHSVPQPQHARTEEPSKAMKLLLGTTALLKAEASICQFLENSPTLIITELSKGSFGRFALSLRPPVYGLLVCCCELTAESKCWL